MNIASRFKQYCELQSEKMCLHVLCIAEGYVEPEHLNRLVTIREMQGVLLPVAFEKENQKNWKRIKDISEQFEKYPKSMNSDIQKELIELLMKELKLDMICNDVKNLNENAALA